MNAFTLPNGLIYLSSSDNELDDDQISIMIGHEISHVLLSHSIEIISFNALLNLILFPPLVLFWITCLLDQNAIIAHLTLTSLVAIYFMAYLRRLELEADHIGMILSAKACFDIRQAPKLWSLIESKTIANVFKWFTRHPTFHSRKNFAKSKMATLLTLRRNFACPLLGPFKETPIVSEEIMLSFTNKVWYIFMDLVQVVTILIRYALC